MSRRLAILLGLFILLLDACGPRSIQKLPVPQEDQLKALRLMVEGDELLRERKDHLAMLKYLEASQLNPYHEVIFNKLAVAYVRIQMYFQAGRAIDRALGLNRKYAYAYNTKGIIQLASRSFGPAVKSFERAISLENDVANFYLNLGYALIQAGRPAEARAAYQRALTIAPNILEDGNFIELTFEGDESPDPGKLYDLARVFADLGSLDYCLRYLEKAISAGFSDFERIRKEEAFLKFTGLEKYQNFLQIHGI